MDDDFLNLPDDVLDNVRSVAQLHAEHLRSSSKAQHQVNLAVSIVGRPGSLAVLTFVIVAWIALNLLTIGVGRKPIDPPPFQWLELGGSFVALYLTLLILITQRHDDLIGKNREQLTLQLAILSDQKAAKIIELLEELRRDSPHLENREDDSAKAMASPVDPHSVLKAIKRSNSDVI